MRNSQKSLIMAGTFQVLAVLALLICLFLTAPGSGSRQGSIAAIAAYESVAICFLLIAAKCAAEGE